MKACCDMLSFSEPQDFYLLRLASKEGSHSGLSSIGWKVNADER